MTSITIFRCVFPDTLAHIGPMDGAVFSLPMFFYAPFARATNCIVVFHVGSTTHLVDVCYQNQCLFLLLVPELCVKCQPSDVVPRAELFWCPFPRGQPCAGHTVRPISIQQPAPSNPHSTVSSVRCPFHGRLDPLAIPLAAPSRKPSAAGSARRVRWSPVIVERRCRRDVRDIRSRLSERRGWRGADGTVHTLRPLMI